MRTGGYYGVYTRRGRDELKVIDSGAITGNVPNSGVLVLLNGVSQGTDYTNRIGRKILLKSMLFRFSLFPNPSVTAPTGGVGDIVRLLIIYDAQSNASAPSVSDILVSVAYNEPMNLNNRDRFKILADKFFTMGAYNYSMAANLDSGSPRPVHTKIYKKFNLEQIFGGTGSTIGSIQTGSIYALVISANNQICTMIANSRIRFIDS